MKLRDKLNDIIHSNQALSHVYTFAAGFGCYRTYLEIVEKDLNETILFGGITSFVIWRAYGFFKEAGK